MTNFNSHTREGVTRYLVHLHVCGDFNSHTREGVTHFYYPFLYGLPHFNSHTREGVTMLFIYGYFCIT